MNKEDQLIMVIERQNLFKNDQFQGFKHKKETDYESRILSYFKYMRRGSAETDPTHKQPIGYAIILNPELKKVYAYQRSSKDKHYSERRLYGKWSIGVGGHIERFDNISDNPIRASMLREIEEEIGINPLEIEVLGYINDESNEVGQVHFGILYIIKTKSKNIKPNNPEIEEGKLVSINELETISKEFIVEDWSKIALQPLKEYLEL